jgi:hypothetical protein
MLETQIIESDHSDENKRQWQNVACDFQINLPVWELDKIGILFGQHRYEYAQADRDQTLEPGDE